MDAPSQPDRRTFLQRLGTVAGGSFLLSPALMATMDLACAAQEEGTPFRVLSTQEAAFVEAVAARIIPTDHRPGAREAGVIHFIDIALDTIIPFQSGADSIRETMGVLETQSNAVFSGLSEERQDELLRGIETDPGFQTMRFLTIAGFFSHPRNGGNRDKVGWKLAGFDDRHAWTPPFGFYDAEVQASNAVSTHAKEEGLV